MTSGNARLRYFRKRLDWSAEQEFGLVVLGDAATAPHVYVPIEGALKCITVGSRFGETNEAALFKICEESRVPATRIVYSACVFLNPFGPSSLDPINPAFS